MRVLFASMACDSSRGIPPANQRWRLVRRDGARPSIQGGPLPVERDEPLRLELADFVRAVTDRATPRVDGAAGRRALALATTIAEKMESV